MGVLFTSVDPLKSLRVHLKRLCMREARDSSTISQLQFADLHEYVAALSTWPSCVSSWK